jgi:hypothetical protein
MWESISQGKSPVLILSGLTSGRRSVLGVETFCFSTSHLRKKGIYSIEAEQRMRVIGREREEPIWKKRISVRRDVAIQLFSS